MHCHLSKSSRRPRIALICLLGTLAVAALSCAQAEVPSNPDAEETDTTVDESTEVSDGSSDSVDTSTDLEAPDSNDATDETTVDSVVLGGNLDCLGGSAPSDPSGERTFDGETHQFGAQIIVPGVEVSLLNADGELLAYALSDDWGAFEMAYEDTVESREGYFELSHPDYVTTRSGTTHPLRRWVDGSSLPIASAGERDLLRLGTGVDIDPDMGVIHGELMDCEGESQVSGATVRIEPSSGELFFSGAELGYTNEIDVTSANSHFLFVNVEPGTYQVTVTAESDAGEVIDLVTSTTYHVAADTLTTQIIWPQ